MTGYIIKRLIGVAINLVLVSILVFFILGVMPGDIASIHLGQDARPEQVQQWREEHGLTGSIPSRYIDWASGVITGDFGKSLRSNLPVVDEFMRRLPVTIEILLISFTVTTLLGIAGGIVSATRQNSGADYTARVFAIAFLSIPNFLLLTLLLIIPARLWKYAPPFGSAKFFDGPLDNLELFVPATVLLAISASAGLMRLTRSAFLEVMRQDYMRTARAKGLTERTVTFRHGFRNAIPPVLTLLGLQLANLLGGSIILESVMSLPGLGNWALSAISFNDYPIVMVVALYAATVIMVISLVIDLTYAWLDPRIRYS
jgi:peptide/nickel transport system permease protein